MGYENRVNSNYALTVGKLYVAGELRVLAIRNACFLAAFRQFEHLAAGAFGDVSGNEPEAAPLFGIKNF